MAALRQHDTFSVLADAASGITAGCCSTVVGQPFDTVKVRLQTHSAFYTGPIDCARQTLKHEGVRGFFKGLVPPMLGTGASNALLFPAYEHALKTIDSSDKPGLVSVFVAGTIGGFFRTFVLTPIELVKCRLQVQDGHAINNYSGPIDCAKHIYQRNGLRGLFLGQIATMSREIPSMGAYFTAYEFSKRSMLERNMNLHSALIVSGGLAGIACWVGGYPQDVIKSSVQTIAEDASSYERTVTYQAKRLYRLGGWRIFFSGLETALMRSVPVNACALYTYEIMSEMLRQE